MTQSTEQGTIWLTQEAYDKLQAELENLKGPVRQEVIARISAARDEGDLKENGGYHAARDEQGKVEARIRQLEERLEAMREAGDQLWYCVRHAQRIHADELIDAIEEWQEARNHG